MKTVKINVRKEQIQKQAIENQKKYEAAAALNLLRVFIRN